MRHKQFSGLIGKFAKMVCFTRYTSFWPKKIIKMTLSAVIKWFILLLSLIILLESFAETFTTLKAYLSWFKL